MGSRPMNSGIIPYFSRSWGMMCDRVSDSDRLLFGSMCAPNPMAVWRMRDSMILSSPSKAPPHTKRMLVVSI